MIPILYSESEERFDSNGLGMLTDALTAEVAEQLNGTYELEMKYPLSGIHAQEISDRCLILAKPDPVTDPQPFRIYRINAVSKGTIMVYARHIAYDTMGIPVSPYTAYSAADAMNGLTQNAATACPFRFSTDKSTAATMTSMVPKPIWKLLGGSEGSILDTYGGEYEFDRYHIMLHEHRGTDRGVSIRYGKNLTTLEQDRSCADVYTGVYPYWASMEGNLVQLPEKILNAPGTYSFVKIMTLDLSEKFQDAPTEAQLREKAEQYMADNRIGIPDVSWKVEFVQLEQTEEYKGTAILERIYMGDTVTVVFPAMQVDVAARAVERRFDVLMERFSSITLGKVRANLADTIVRQQENMNRFPTKMTMAQEIANKLAIAMGVNSGSIRLMDTNGDGEPDELYIADDPDPAQAVKVWRFNYLGWAASKTGYNGPFTMGATLEDGLLAEFVTAAHLVAGTIQSKDGSFFLDLDNGILQAAALDIMVKKGDVSSQISAETGIVSLKGNRVIIESDNFNLNKNGEVQTNGTFKARVENEMGIFSTVLEAGVLSFRDETDDAYWYTPHARIMPVGDTAYTTDTNSLLIESYADGVVIKSWNKNWDNENDGVYVNGGLNPYGYTESIVLYGDTRVASGGLYFHNGGYFYPATGFDGSSPGASFHGDLYATGSLGCGGTKYRLVETENYGTVGMNAMESTNAYFSDMGSVTLDETGFAEVFADPVFFETVDLSHDYQVFTSSGEVSKVEKYKDYFTVHGNPGACVDWIVFCRQKGYTADRMETVCMEKQEDTSNLDKSVFRKDNVGAVQSQMLMEEYNVNYEAQAKAYLENYEQEIYGYDY